VQNRANAKLFWFIAAVLVLAQSICFANPAAAAGLVKTEPFYLKDGDRVVFYGDSITDQRQYTTYIESYCVTRFPKSHFTFVHSGWGGDRVGGGGGGPIDVRIKRDILPYKPTVITICLGMNDGSYRAFDQGIFDTYVKGYRHILDTLKTELPATRITLLTAPAYDDVTRAPGFPGGYNATLVKYGAAVADLAKEYKCTLADTNAPLVTALEKAKAVDAELAAKLIPDRVHPGHGGHMVMAAAVLKAWNAPPVVADIHIDAGRMRVVSATGTKVQGLKSTTSGMAFTHTDSALPWPIDRDPAKDKDMLLALQVTDYESTLNKCMLTVQGLPDGKYALKVDGTEVAQTTGQALGAGLDLAAIPELPINQQAREVLALTRKHNDLHFRRWRQVQFPVSKNNEPVPTDVKAQMDDLDKQDEDAALMQRDAAVPRPHTVEIIPIL
jgi:lysophospholipase L1-like esterase